MMINKRLWLDNTSWRIVYNHVTKEPCKQPVSLVSGLEISPTAETHTCTGWLIGIYMIGNSKILYFKICKAVRNFSSEMCKPFIYLWCIFKMSCVMCMRFAHPHSAFLHQHSTHRLFQLSHFYKLWFMVNRRVQIFSSGGTISDKIPLSCTNTQVDFKLSRIYKLWLMGK